MLSDMHPLYDDRIYWKECISLKENGFDVVHIGVGNTKSDSLSKEGIRLISVTRKKFTKNIYLDILIRKLIYRNRLYKDLYTVAREQKSDFYNIHDLKTARLISRLKALPHKPKVIYSIHESFPDKIRDYHSSGKFVGLFKNLYASYIDGWEKKKASGADYIITFDDALHQKFAMIAGENRVRKIYNFANLFPDEGKKLTRIYDLIYIGGINEQRGILNIIKAVALCREKLPDIRLLLLGVIYEPYFEKLIFETIDKLNIKANVEFKGWVEYTAISDYLSRSKIGMVTWLPIPKFYKNIPIKQFEYMAFGLPVIGSNLPTIAKFVEPANAGILVDPENIEMISSAIIRLLTDKKYYNTLSNHAKKAARECYNWKSEEKKYLELFRN